MRSELEFSGWTRGGVAGDLRDRANMNILSQAPRLWELSWEGFLEFEIDFVVIVCCDYIN